MSGGITSSSGTATSRDDVHAGAPASAGDLKRATVATLFERTVSSLSVDDRRRPALRVIGRERQLAPGDVDRFVALVLGDDDLAPRTFIREVADAGVQTDAIYLDLLTPTAARLGELWESDDCDFVDVTIALGRMQRTLREISQVFIGTPEVPVPTGSALLTCIPGEQHTLGIVMIADALIRDGWHVQVGAPWSDADLATLIRSETFDVLGVSLACEARIPQLRRQVSALRAASRNQHVRVLVGGQAFVGRSDLIKRVDADGFAETLRDIVPVARRLLAHKQS
jgi:MerR family transcriptional regulator, light-induced transcriptional regulator